MKFKVVDLFAGPGGLAEGFSALRNAAGDRLFDISLSVEKEPSAFKTLRLRSFFRQFERAPQAYYDYIAGRIPRERMIGLHPTEWEKAVAETKMLELGTTAAQEELDPILDSLRNGSDPTVLIGGPPCQAYSLVGRARNKGIAGYDAASDHRHFLYKEYIRIIERLQPAAFVMENVKGILSSKVSGDAIFNQVLADLQAAGGTPDSYALIPLAPGVRKTAADFIVRCEEFGIPQCRHRVIVVGIRKDLVAELSISSLNGLLKATPSPSTVADVIGGMPILRSGLSREPDGAEEWRTVAAGAMKIAARACDKDGTWLKAVAKRLRETASMLAVASDIPSRSSTAVAGTRENRLGAWLSDPDLDSLPNHETRGHRRDDLARYAFVATFGEIFGRSPKADEFPALLAPDHRNWDSGKFADRFRAQLWNRPSTTVTSHISKDGHYFIHPDPKQCRSLTVREAARLQTFPDNYCFEGNRTEQFVQVGNAVPPLMARQIADALAQMLEPRLATKELVGEVAA